MASIGLPGFANFWGELTIFTSLWQNYKCAAVCAVAGIVISAVYGLRAMAKVFYGQPTEAFSERFKNDDMQDVYFHERIPAIILLAALLLVGLWPQFISGKLNDALKLDYARPSAVAEIDTVADETASVQNTYYTAR